MKRFVFILCVLLSLCLLGCGAAPAQLSDYIIDTEDFTLTLPEGWINDAVCQVVPDGDRYAIECFERQDYELNGNGKLCTIRLFADGEGFTLFDHMAYGKLVTKNTNYEVVVIYPDEVTYTPANADRHHLLLESIDEFVKSLEPKDGCKWLVPTWDIPNPPGVDKSVIELLYYSVKLPPDWEGNVIDSIEEFEDGSSIVNFYERERFLLDGYGKICAIQLLPIDADWSAIPGATLYCSLITPDKSFLIVGVFPEEKQYTKDTMELYLQLREQTPELFSNIAPNEGCTLNHEGF